MRAEPQEWDDTKAQKRDRLGGHRVSQGPSVGLPPSFHVLAVNWASSEPTGGLRAPTLANTPHRLSVCWHLHAHVTMVMMHLPLGALGGGASCRASREGHIRLKQLQELREGQERPGSHWLWRMVTRGSWEVASVLYEENKIKYKNPTLWPLSYLSDHLQLPVCLVNEIQDGIHGPRRVKVVRQGSLHSSLGVAEP